MKNLLVLMALMSSLCACFGQKIDCNLEKTVQQLEEIHQKDQEIRLEFMELLGKYQESGEGALKLMMVGNKMENIDEENQEYVLGLLEECGWSNELSEEAHQTIFLVIQHADTPVIQKYISWVKEKVDSGHLMPDDYATMLDRKLMYENKPQIYGTQTFADKETNINYVWPIQSPDSVNIRRTTVGLPEMDEYLKLALDSFQVKMEWDPTLTLEKAKAMRADK